MFYGIYCMWANANISTITQCRIRYYSLQNNCRTADPDLQNLGQSGKLSFFTLCKFWQNCAMVRQVSDLILKTAINEKHTSSFSKVWQGHYWMANGVLQGRMSVRQCLMNQNKFDNLVSGKIDQFDIVWTWGLQGNHQVFLCIKEEFNWQ